jgi:acetyl-CoA carboxylase carboxyltransferase component
VVNIIVDGTCVGAQSYWNAEATMLAHCRGALVMTPSGCMLLTGKRALEYSGSVSAPTNLGIGGLDEVMGPNGQAQYSAPNLRDAYALLFQHYALTYVPPSEGYVRAVTSSDPAERDVTRMAYNGSEGFATIGEIFSDEANPGRKRPFSVREVLRAVADQDVPVLERWSDWEGAETAVTCHAQLGGQPVCLIGIESMPLRRRGEIPSDGPDGWSSGTLFPQSSRKVARAIQSVSGVCPVVVLANLSGFDGSPESLRRWQLEYGAQIGRAVVNFKGPIIFNVIARYHGGAYVVFSQGLNESLKSVALEGTYASVIGGGPAAAVVFSGLVRRRTRADGRIQEAQAHLATTNDLERPAAQTEYEALYRKVEAEVQSAVALEFDNVHTVQRAKDVGSLSEIITPERLRPFLITSIREGLDRYHG